MELHKVPSRISQLPFVETILLALVVLCLFFLYSYSISNKSLIDENIDLRKQMDALRQAEIGDAVPPIETVDLQGQPRLLSFRNHQASVLITARASCPFCVADFQAWNDLVPQLRRGKLNVVALFFDSLSFADETIPLNLTALRSVTQVSSENKNLRTYRAHATPQISIVSEDGVITWTHVGQLDENKINELLVEAAKYR